MCTESDPRVAAACDYPTRSGETFTTFKFPDFNLARSDVPKRGLKLCITLSDECPTLRQFCYGNGNSNSCRISFLSEDEVCCPTGTMLWSEDGSNREAVMVEAPPIPDDLLSPL